MEEKIYERQVSHAYVHCVFTNDVTAWVHIQVTKESLSLRVVDEKQIGRHFSQAELSELFEYSPAERRETPDPSISEPKVS